MKIEKGKLYYNTISKTVFKCQIDVKAGSFEQEFMLECTDKIAVHCPTEEDKLYVSKKYNLESIDEHSSNYILINEDDACGNDWTGLRDYYLITVRKFKEFYPEKGIESTDTADNTNPIHYNTKGIQPIDYIEANNMNFNEGNVVKYVTRYKEKNGLEDLKKARVYLDRLINKYGK